MTIKKLILPDAKGNLKEKDISQKREVPKIVVPPGHSLFMLNIKEKKIYALSLEFELGRNDVARCNFKIDKKCLYTVAISPAEAEKNFINRLNNKSNERKKKEKQG